MSMQCLRETLDAREIETRLHALAESSTKLDASDLAEISEIRTRVNECAEIARLINASLAHDEPAKCVASSQNNALLAVDHFATERGEQHDSTILNDGSIDAWGWSEETPDGEMTWRVTIRIVPAKVNT